MGSRLAGLDFVKGVAIIWVVAFHVFKDFPTWWDVQSPIEQLFYRFVASGAMGVNLFIIASGLTLPFAWQRMQQKGKGWPSFWGKRFLRILPMYYAAIIFVLAMDFIIGPENFDLKIDSLIYHVFGLHTFTEHMFGIEGAWWFMGLIIQLYFLFPVLQKLREHMSTVLLLLGTIILAVVARQIPLLNLDSNYSVFAFMPGFVFGMWLGEQYQSESKLLSQPLLWVYSVLGIFLLYLWALGHVSFFDGLGLVRHIVAVMIFLFLYTFANLINRSSKFSMFAAIVCLFGLYAYPVYLFHRPLIYKYVTTVSTYLAVLPAFLLFLAVLLLTGWMLQEADQGVRKRLARRYAWMS